MNKLLSITMVMLFPFIVFAQSIDDIGKIVVGVKFSAQSSAETLAVQDVLKNKLSQLATQSGYSAFGNENLFVITPNVVVNSVEIAEGGMKNVYLVRGNLYLSIKENTDNIVYSSISLPFQSSSVSKGNALRNAIVNIEYKDVEQVFAGAKTKILSYYESKQDAIFAHADTYVANKQYDGAISCLMSVPQELFSVYKKSLSKANQVYRMKMEEERRQLQLRIERHNNSIINKANSLLSMHQAKDALIELWKFTNNENNSQETAVIEIRRQAERLISNQEQGELLEAERNYNDAKERENKEFELRKQSMDITKMDLALQRKYIEREINETKLVRERENTLRTIALEYIIKNIR